MPALSRTQTRLLRVVNKQPHATDADHEVIAPLESAVAQDHNQALDVVDDEEADILRSPVSSEDEADAVKTTSASHLEHLANHISRKRASPHDDDHDNIFFPNLGSSQPKRVKISSSAGDAVPPRPRVPRKYGSQSSQSTKAATLKQAKGHKAAGGKSKGFKAAKEIDTSPRTAQNMATFKRIELHHSLMTPSESSRGGPTSSPPLSPLTTPPDSPEVEIIDLASDGTWVKCAICQRPVDALIRQEYEDTYNEGRELSVRRQDAFCQFHKRSEARQLWQQRGYPDIHWESGRLEVRMKKQRARLKGILQGQTASTFQDRLAEQIASRLDRQIKTAFKSSPDESAHISAGYYGPQGQKIMLEYISEQLSDELRIASLTNPTIKAVGTGGGVSGYVQNVLVPEMAIGLIAEDMKTTHQLAALILRESKPLGDLLHDEIREEVVNMVDV